jgi:c-di-GMP-binding flagellar brake protein YcgR
VVTAACESRLAVEFHYLDGDGLVVTAQARFLDQTADEILTDRPQYLDDHSVIPLGAPVTVHFAFNGVRSQFDSAIVDEDRAVRINLHQTLPGIALRKPAVIKESQRRTSLRISTVGYDPISVDLAAPHLQYADACDIDVERISGWMSDLSAGGVSVVADHRVLQATARGERFFITFALPDVKEDFNLLGSIRHSRAVRNGESVRAALCFCPWNGKQFGRDQQRLSRFIADHERRMLRRRR